MSEPLIKLPSMIIKELEAEIADQKVEIADQKAEIVDQKSRLADKDAEIQRLQRLVAQLSFDNCTL